MGVPAGTGMYQQLITINNPSKYGINANGSNIGFYDGSNNTHLYAWIQLINSTSMQVWVKNYNGSSTIDMQVLPSFENLFSPNGYLGEADTITDNGKLVFFAYWNAYTPLNEFYNISGVKLVSYNYNGKQVIGLFGYNQDTFPTLIYKAQNIPQGNYIIHSYAEHLDNLTGGLGASNGLVGLYGTDWNRSAIDAEMGFSNSYIALTYINSTSVGYPPIGQQGSAVSEWINTSLYYNQTQYFSATFQSGSTSYTSIANANSNPISGNMYMGVGIFGTSPSVEFQSIYQYEFATSDIVMPTFTIGAFTNMTDHAVASYLSNSITIPMPNWFNLTLKAYTNYSFTFHYNNTPLYFTYDGLINNTIYTGFLDSNLTLDIHFIALGYSGKTELIVVGEKT